MVRLSKTDYLYSTQMPSSHNGVPGLCAQTTDPLGTFILGLHCTTEALGPWWHTGKQPVSTASWLCIVRCLSGGRNSSVGSAWARCPQCHGFDPPQGTFSGRGDFSLGVNMGSNSIPPKTPSDESINRGLVCAHMHFIARTQKILTFMS